MKELEIKLLSKDAVKPTRAYEISAGLDIYASETVTLRPQQKHLLKTDVAVNIPDGYVGLLTSRSGVSSKTSLVIETGKIDAGYLGEMKINIKNDEQRLDEDVYLANKKINGLNPPLLYDIKNEKINNGNPFDIFTGKTYEIKKGDKIAQLVIVPIVTPEAKIVDNFKTESARGDKGFGSSDKEYPHDDSHLWFSKNKIE